MDTRIQRCSPDIGFRGRIQQPRNCNVSVGRLSAGAPNCTDLPRRTRENSYESWNSRSSPTAVRSDRHRGDGCTGLCMPWHTPHAERTVFSSLRVPERPSGVCPGIHQMPDTAPFHRVPARYALLRMSQHTERNGTDRMEQHCRQRPVPAIPPRARMADRQYPILQDAEQKGKPHAHRIRVHGACAFSFRPRLELTDGTRNQASAAVSSGMPGPIVEVMVALVM